MITLEEVSKNLIGAVQDYENVPLIDTDALSEILRTIGVNISYMVQLRKEYYHKFQYTVQQSKGTSQAARIKEAEFIVPELDEIRKILRHYGDLQSDIRTQISLHKIDK